ncbi:hypothetical protein EVAR_87798_1 [Eumeta japonica]|uniref:Uncharacterized protein n=1 Tax=Eumeta variegata TaxID=151549 RepID=A0A4C1X4Z5_EUMVA|nr:hypothetical protein EVAR_87798_1 [Eumeta japonica]
MSAVRCQPHTSIRNRISNGGEVGLLKMEYDDEAGVGRWKGSAPPKMSFARRIQQRKILLHVCIITVIGSDIEIQARRGTEPRVGTGTEIKNGTGAAVGCASETRIKTGLGSKSGTMSLSEKRGRD